MPVPTAVLPPDLAARLQRRLSPAAGLRAGAVRVASDADVVATVRLAGRHGVAVAVRRDGFPVPAPGRGLVVDPAGLDELTVSAGGWARVGAGVRWRQLLDATARYALAPLTGAYATERIAESVTGGGVGPVARTYGLASDRVRAVELVTGDGVLRRVTPAEHAELFWAVRGSGALGLVTAVELDLLATGTLWAGSLEYGPADAAPVLAAWCRWAPGLPPQAGTSAVLTGRRERIAGVSVRFSWTGDPDDGAAALEPLRRGVTPARADVGLRTPAQLDPAPAGPWPGAESSLLLDGLSPDGRARLLRAAAGGTQRLVELRLLGGSIAWVPERSSAVCHRDARLAVRVVGGTGAEERAATRACVDELAAVLGPLTGGRAAAHGSGPAPDVLARTPSPAVRERLAALGADTDPHRILAAAAGT